MDMAVAPCPSNLKQCCSLQGSVVVRQKRLVAVKLDASGLPVERERNEPTVLHCDIIRDDFWKENPALLS